MTCFVFWLITVSGKNVSEYEQMGKCRSNFSTTLMASILKSLALIWFMSTSPLIFCNIYLPLPLSDVTEHQCCLLSAPSTACSIHLRVPNKVLDPEITFDQLSSKITKHSRSVRANGIYFILNKWFLIIIICIIYFQIQEFIFIRIQRLK